MARNLVRVQRLGLLRYSDAYDLQRRLVDHLLERRSSAAASPDDRSRHHLLLLEHPSVYTVGVRGAAYGEKEAQRLQALGADFVRTDRGGLITWHGPGQLIAYPILDLKLFRPDASRSTGVRWYVDRLERALIAACEGGGLRGAVAPGPPLTGVWTPDVRRKVASIGIHVRDLVTSHGAALNCDPDLTWFTRIVPCGLPDAQMTSLTRETGRTVSVDETAGHFLIAFKQCFECDFVYD